MAKWNAEILVTDCIERKKEKESEDDGSAKSGYVLIDQRERKKEKKSKDEMGNGNLGNEMGNGYVLAHRLREKERERE